MQNEINIYNVSLQVRIPASSEAEALIIGYNLLLGRSQDQASGPVEQYVSQASLDALFVFEDELDAA